MSTQSNLDANSLHETVDRRLVNRRVKIMRSFEELRIWQDSRSLVKDIYALNERLKDYGFKDQIQRASISIMNNIAEGCDSGSDNLFLRYLHIAKGSCGEVKSMLYVGEDLGYYPPHVALALREKVKSIVSGIQRLIAYLKTKK